MFIGLFSKKEVVVATEGMHLPMKLQFFADPEPPADPPAEPPADDPKPKDPPADDPNDHMVPRSRLNEVNNNYKTVKEQLDKILKEKEDSELEDKKKQGEYQTLYEEAAGKLKTYETDRESTKTRMESLEGVLNSMLSSKLEAIPEDFHDLIPENLSPEQKLDWVSKAEAKGLFKDDSQEPVGGPTNPPAEITDLENLNTFQLLQNGYGSKK